MRPLLQLLLAICGVQVQTVVGTPLEKRASNTCAAESLVISLLNKSYAASATTYCSSFIKKSTTVTTTSTPTSLTTITPTTGVTTIPTVVITIDTYATTSAAPTTFDIVQTVSSGTTTLPDPTTDCAAPARLMERAATVINSDGAKILPDPTVKLAKRASTSAPCPAPLKSLASSLVSSICSCIVTPTTSTSTVVKTGSATTLTATASPVTTTATASPVTASVITTVSTVTQNDYIYTTTTTIIPTATAYAEASYCTGGDITGNSIGAAYIPQCDSSYLYLANAAGYSSSYQTVATYDACLDLCDQDGNCIAFSFLKTTCTNNCFLLDEGAFSNPTPQPDPDVDSGEFNGVLVMVAA